MSNTDRAWTGWRLAAAAGLLLLVGGPLAMPFLELAHHGEGWRAWGERERLLPLARTTAGLALGTVALALPAGTAVAVLLYRTDLPGRRALRFLVLLALFVPLPLVASAWQAALGVGGWLPVAVWNRVAAGDPDVSPAGMVWKPWAQGLGAAVWVHAAAALPWVILIVGQGLLWVEPELEEDALTAAGPWRVLWSVTLPRCRAAVLAAGLWVGLQTATDITVTDAMQVRTFAEEVYTQFGLGDRAALARAVAVAVPEVVLAWALVVWAAFRLRRSLPPLDARLAAPVVFRLGKARLPCLALGLTVIFVLVAVPLGSLVWKMGLGGTPAAWSERTAWAHFSTAARLRWKMVGGSLVLAGASGALVAGLGLGLSWLAVESRWLRAAMVCLLAAALALPGPVIGLGLKEAIGRVIELPHSALLARALYYGPSPLPLLWSDLIRFLPFALAALWPVVRLVPVELREAARVDGARPGQEFRRVVLPLTLPACAQAGLVLATLSLGEISAGKLVETPGAQNFAHEVFNLMHYGVTNDLAALCLLLLAAVGGVALVAGAGRLLLAAADRGRAQGDGDAKLLGGKGSPTRHIG